MKKTIPILAVIVAFILGLCSCNDAEGGKTGLRDITWGMTRTEVRKAESAELVGYDDAFLRFYDTDKSQPIVELGVNTNNAVDLLYYFDSKDKLFKIEYKFSSTKINEDYYKLLKSLMIDKYGKPYKEDAADENNEYNKVTSWKKGKSDITLIYYNPEGLLKTFYVTFLPNN